MHKDQEGFVIFCSVGDNTRRAVDIVDILTKVKSEALILSPDAEKAFDHLSWPFLFAVL